MFLRRLGLAVLLFCDFTACRKAPPSENVTPNPGIPNPAPAPVGTPNPAQPGTGTPSNSEPTLAGSFTAEQFYKAYKDDRKGMNAKYTGKLIEVKGLVRFLYPWSDQKSGHVQLVGDPSKDYDTVGCRTTDPEPWKTVVPGQQATVVGVFDPTGGQLPSLKDARIIRVEGAPPPPVEVAKLFADFEADPKRFDATYSTPRGALHTIVGRFSKMGTNAGSPCWVLEGPKSAKLEITFSPLLAKQPSVPKPGQEIKFVSSCSGYAPDHEIHFPNAMVLSVTP